MRKQKRAAGVAQGGLNPEFKALVPQKKKKSQQNSVEFLLESDSYSAHQNNVFSVLLYIWLI
jgi:hypothetical protein